MQYTVGSRLLTITNLNLQYGEKTILRDINLSVDDIHRPGVLQGQVIALLGLSGAGKTQLFRCIAGMQQVTSGEIKLDNDQHNVKAGDVGVVQQSYPLMNHRTVWSNLMMVARTPEAKAKAEEYLAHFGLADKKTSYPLQLSGGQRQRVAIIQQLLCSSHFLLMDEPFSGLDVVAKRRVFDTIQKVSTADELNTVIFTTHDLEAAVTLADHIWVVGKEKDKEGTTVIQNLDLAAMGLAWAPDIQRHPLYFQTVLQLKDLFNSL